MDFTGVAGVQPVAKERQPTTIKSPLSPGKEAPSFLRDDPRSVSLFGMLVNVSQLTGGSPAFRACDEERLLKGRKSMESVEGFFCFLSSNTFIGVCVDMLFLFSNFAFAFLNELLAGIYFPVDRRF